LYCVGDSETLVVALDNKHGFVAFASTGNLFSQDVANHNWGFGFDRYGGSRGNTVTHSVAHANPFADAADFDQLAPTRRSRTRSELPSARRKHLR